MRRTILVNGACGTRKGCGYAFTFDGPVQPFLHGRVLPPGQTPAGPRGDPGDLHVFASHAGRRAARCAGRSGGGHETPRAHPRMVPPTAGPSGARDDVGERIPARLHPAGGISFRAGAETAPEAGAFPFNFGVRVQSSANCCPFESSSPKP